MILCKRLQGRTSLVIIKLSELSDQLGQFGCIVPNFSPFLTTNNQLSSFLNCITNLLLKCCDK